MNPTVSLCCVVHNDLARLKAVLLHECRWVDQVCILDLASTDGTKKFCDSWLRDGDAYHRRDRNTAPDLGFAEARNVCMDLATSDWCLESGGNVVMWTPGYMIKETLAGVTRDVVGIEHRHLARFKECQPHQIEEAIDAGAIASVEFNVRAFIRRNSGVRYRGYLHEEPWRGDVNTFDETYRSNLVRYHFHTWGDHALRHLRYHWMLNRAMKEPALREGTNPWWFDTYCPQHVEEILRCAAAYEAHPLSHLPKA